MPRNRPPLSPSPAEPRRSHRAEVARARRRIGGPAADADSPVKELPSFDKTTDFYFDDFLKTLFPLHTNKVLIERGEPEIQAYIKRCLDEKDEAVSFNAQQRVYAAKPGRYLRRTVKLDVIADYFIYDLIYRNRVLFRKPHTPNRTHYGYRFERGRPIAASAAYKAFKSALSEYREKYKRSLALDVTAYFNNVYHHDLVSWFSELGASDADVEGLGQLLREINSGRSIDCLPQGLYPTKMIGNDLLRFIDNYHDLASEKVARFMDDIYLFSNDEGSLEDDFQVIQGLLGDKGLSVNPRKTQINELALADIDNEIDEVKKSLLQRRRIMVVAGYDDDGEEIIQEQMIKSPLNDDEIGYIDKILERPNIEEEDAELILTIMRGNVDRVERRLPDIIHAYPHLAKNVHAFCASVPDKEGLADMVLAEAKAQDHMLEYQLFWFGAMLEDYFMQTSKASALIATLFNHRSATPITRAKILEIGDARFGLHELRHRFLVSGQSDWLAWSSAVGSRTLKMISRNHRLKYFGKSSQMNHLVASIMSKE